MSNNFMIESAELPRVLTYGGGAIKRLPEVCKTLGFRKVVVLSGDSATKRITKEVIFPILEESSFLEHIYIPVDCKAVFVANGDNEEIIREIRQSDGVIVVGGGRIIDFCKVICSLADHSPYISVPTAASHDGFSSPYVGFLLRRQIKQEKIPYEPQSPLGIIGDTWLISQAPYKMLSSGAADTLAKFTAVKDWKLANKHTGEPFNEYASTFGQLSASIVEKSSKRIGQGDEQAHRLVVKSLVGSGVAMSIAGNSRPASGSEHLISHQLDVMSNEQGLKPGPHGAQVGLASIVMMYLHKGDWQKIKNLLIDIKSPTTIYELGIEREFFINAVLHASEIRPERYTILSMGITRGRVEEALETTGVG
ncbi:MAG: iron-containing alcohol dehydrogenase [Candidatus Hermodarchaeota archaeon]